MPRFEFKSPDGRVIAIDGPEGATQEQAFQIVQQMEAARSERIAAATAAEQQRVRNDFKGSMSGLEKFVIGGGRGFTDLTQGVKQLGLNAGAALGVVDDKTAEDYNAQVRDEAAMFERDLGDSFAAGAGRIGAQIAASAPLGGAGGGFIKAGTTAANQIGRAALVGAATGGATSGLNAVTEDGSYWGQKAGQVATGTAFGGTLGAAGQGVVRGLQGIANAPRAAANAVADAVQPQTPQSFSIAIKAAEDAGDTLKVEQLRAAAEKAGETVGTVGQFVRGSTAANRRGDRIAEASGIDLSPAQRSTGKAATQLENMARQSIFTRERMFLGDFRRGRQMVNAITSMTKGMGGEAISPESFAQRLQGTVKNMVQDMARRRTDVAGGAFRDVERIAGGAPIVKANNTLDEVARLADEFGDVSTADGQKIKAWAEGFFDRLSGDGSMTPTRAVRELQGWSQAGRTGVGLFDGIADRSTAKTAANRLANALMRDMDETADGASGTVGEALKRANALWRQYSGEIDTIEASALGRIVGDDMVGELSGTAFNTTSPERVLKVLEGLSPTELSTVKDYLIRQNPQMWQQFQRVTVERALETARTQAPSLGDRALPINPAAFVRAMEGAGGRSGATQADRFRVIFDGAPSQAKLESILSAGRRMSDMTGYNFSGTGAFNEASGVMQNLTNLGRGAAAQLGGLTGLQVIARGAQPGAARVPLRMLEAPRAASVAAAIPVGGLAAEGSRQALEVEASGGTPMDASEADRLNRALIEYRRRQEGQ